MGRRQGGGREIPWRIQNVETVLCMCLSITQPLFFFFLFSLLNQTSASQPRYTRRGKALDQSAQFQDSKPLADLSFHDFHSVIHLVCPGAPTPLGNPIALSTSITSYPGPNDVSVLPLQLTLIHSDCHRFPSSAPSLSKFVPKAFRAQSLKHSNRSW